MSTFVVRYRPAVMAALLAAILITYEIVLDGGGGCSITG